MAGSKRQADVKSLVRGVFSEGDREPLLMLSLLRRHWPDVVGPELAGRTYPRRLARGTLWIAAPDACWAYELQFFKTELLNSVQTFLESQAVRELRFQVGEVPTAAAAPSEASAGTAPSDPLPPVQAVPPHAELSQAELSQAEPPQAELSRSELSKVAPSRAGLSQPGPSEGDSAGSGAAEAIGDPALRRAFHRLLTRRRTRS